jgi:hypothetical protein
MGYENLSGKRTIFASARQVVDRFISKPKPIPVLMLLLLAGGSPFTAVDSVAHDPRIQAIMDSITDSAVHPFISGLFGEDSVTIGGIPCLMLTRHMGSVADLDFAHTVRFVFSTGHHQGLLGSSAYAEQAYYAGGQIAGVLCFDMIGYATHFEPGFDLHTRTPASPQYAADSSLAATFVAVVDTYGLGSDISAEVHADSPGTSGASSFWDYGFPGICCMEDHDDFNPYYHTVNDRIEHLNVPYCRAIVRGAFGTLCHLAGIVTSTRIAASVPGEMAIEGTRGLVVLHVFGAERRSVSAGPPFGTVTCDLRGTRIASCAPPGLCFVRADRGRS